MKDNNKNSKTTTMADNGWHTKCMTKQEDKNSFMLNNKLNNYPNNNQPH